MKYLNKKKVYSTLKWSYIGLTLQNEAACSRGRHINSPPLISQARPWTVIHLLFTSNFSFIDKTSYDARGKYCKYRLFPLPPLLKLIFSPTNKVAGHYNPEKMHFQGLFLVFYVSFLRFSLPSFIFPSNTYFSTHGRETNSVTL